MRLLVLGSNGTYPTPGRPASGYLVSHPGGSLLLDCGPGVFPALLAAGVVPDGIVLTHVHHDHCLDILPLFNWLRFDATEHWGIPVFAPPGVFRSLASLAGAGPDHDFHRALVSRDLAPGDRLAPAGFTVEVGAAVHPVPAVCVRLESGDRSLTYSGDTGPGGDLPVLARGTDLLLCEATHQGQPPDDRYPYHLFAREAGNLAADAGVGRLVLTHLGPTLDPGVSVAEAATAFGGPITHAVPGMEVLL